MGTRDGRIAKVKNKLIGAFSPLNLLSLVVNAGIEDSANVTELPIEWLAQEMEFLCGSCS